MNMSASLPHSILGLRDDYKRHTKTVVRWLKQNGSSDSPEEGRSSLSELLTWAHIIKEDGIELPKEVGNAFRDTIALRTQMTSWYNQKSSTEKDEDSEESTARHVKFTDTLQAIFDHLSESAAQKALKGKTTLQHTPPSTPSTPTKPEGLQTSNRFAALYREYQEAESKKETSPTTDGSQEQAMEEIGDLQSPNHGKIMKDSSESIEDDVLLLWFDIYMHIANIDALLFTLRSAWSKVARDELPFAVASAMTSFAWVWVFQSIRAVLWLAADQDDPSWAARLLNFCKDMKKTKQDNYPPSPDEDIITYAESIVHPLSVLHDWKSFIDKEDENKREDAFLMISPKPDFAKDVACFEALLQSAWRCEKQIKEQNFHMGFCWIHIDRWLNKKESFVYQFFCATALRFILECQRGYVWPYNDPTASTDEKLTELTLNPTKLVKPEKLRLAYLQIQNETVQTLNALKDHPGIAKCCVGSFGQVCGTFSAEMASRMKEVHFDLLFTSPATVSEMTVCLTNPIHDVIVDLLNHRLQVSGVLHAYNILRFHEEIDLIPILDKLCSIFLDMAFLGELPTSDFCWRWDSLKNSKIDEPTEFEKHNFLPTVSKDDMKAKWRGSDMIMHGHQIDLAGRRFLSPEFDVSLHRASTFSTYPPLFGEGWFWGRVFGLENWDNLYHNDRKAVETLLSACSIRDHPLIRLEEALLAEYNWSATQAPVGFDIPEKSKGQKSGKSWKAEEDDRDFATHPFPSIMKLTFELKFDKTPPKCHGATLAHIASKNRSDKKRGIHPLQFSRLNHGKIWKLCADVILRVDPLAAPMFHNLSEKYRVTVVDKTLKYGDTLYWQRYRDKQSSKKGKPPPPKKPPKKRSVAQELMADPFVENAEEEFAKLVVLWKEALEPLKNMTIEDVMWKHLP